MLSMYFSYLCLWSYAYPNTWKTWCVTAVTAATFWRWTSWLLRCSERAPTSYSELSEPSWTIKSLLRTHACIGLLDRLSS